MDTDTADQTTRSESRQLKDTLEDNDKSRGFRDPNETHAVSDALLLCNFHSEDGKLQVINKLQKLSGKLAVKRICEELPKLSKVYTDSKQFVEEAIALVDLCCSQSKALQDGCKDCRQVASPLNIIDWATKLCDELIRPKEGMHCSANQYTTSLSRYLSKLMEIYEKIKNARLKIVRKNQDGSIEECDPFKILFDALKPRIHFHAFDELLDQVIYIILADDLLDPKMLSKIYITKSAVLLKHWVSLLNITFLSNWFVVAIAKHDFLVNDETFARKQPFSDDRTYNESLICVVCIELDESISKKKEFKLPCQDEARLQIFFDHSEVLLRYPSLCFELLQSDVTTHQIQEVLELLQIKRDDSLLPDISKTESEKLEVKIKTFKQSVLLGNPQRLEEPVGVDSRQASQGSYQQKVICTVVFKALIDLPGDREQLVNVLRIWRDRFSNDNPSTRLFEIISIIFHLKEQGTPNCMGKLQIFLSQLSTELLDAYPSWPSIVIGLITALPTTWFTKECNLVNRILNKCREATDPTYRNVISSKVQLFEKFITSLAEMQGSEQVIRKGIEIGLDLFEHRAQPQNYELVLNVIGFVASDMTSGKIRKYTSDLLKAICDVEINYSNIGNVIRIIHTSNSIENKEEILHCFLKVLQDAKGKDDIEGVMSACAGFLRFPVDSANAKRFLEQAALDSTIYNSILYFLWINEISLEDNKFNEHARFLLNLILDARIEHRHLLLTTVKKNIQWLYYPSVEIFEVIMACMAGSLAVGKFNKEANDEALKLLHTAIGIHKLSAPMDVLSLYIALIQDLHEVSCLGRNGSCTKSFAEGINLIISLPLPLLQQKLLLIHRMATVLEEGKFSKEEEVTNIMFHLFKMPSSTKPFLSDPKALESHFESLTSKSRRLLIASKLSKLSLHKRTEKSETGLHFLMELLIKKIPTAFQDGSSVDLFEFVVNVFSEQPPTIIQLALPLIDATIIKTVSVDEFKVKIKELTQKLPYLPSEQVPLLAECIPEFYAMGINEKQDIHIFIQALLSLKWNMFDTRRMYGNLIPLNIPRQLVSVFKEKTPPKELFAKLGKILDVASNINPSIMLLMKRGKGSDNQILEILAHDFNMLLNHTRLRSNDVCLALLFYNNFQVTEVLGVFLQKEIVSLKDDDKWPVKYDQAKLLTPGKLAYLILHQLRRLGIDDVKTELNKLCSKLVENYNHTCPRICTNQQLPIKFEEYFELFNQIMDDSSSLHEVQYWLDEFSAERALQCKNVIMAASSWKAGRRTSEEAKQMNEEVSATLSKLLNRPVASVENASGSNDLASKLDTMADVIKNVEDEQIVFRLFSLLCLSARAASTAACLQVVPLLSKRESLLLIEQIERLYQGGHESKPEETDKDLAIAFQILPFAAKVLQNSAMELMDFLKMTNEKNGGLADDMSLKRLPIWYKQMTDAGFPSQVIQSWCSSLVFSKSLSSSEVDAVTNLTPETMKLVSKETDYIGQSLFSKDAPKTWKTEDATRDRENTERFKRCLLLARLVNEYLFIAQQLKDNYDVVQKIKNGTEELCRIFEDETCPTGKIYKSRDDLLKELFVLLFSETKDEKPMKQLMNLEPLSKSLVLLLRRLARSVVTRPNTFGHVKTVLRKIQKYSAVETLSPPQRYQLVQRNLHDEVLRLDQNQACIDLLEASGYNKDAKGNENLWCSSSIQMSAYIPAIESVEKNLLGNLMRQLWREWRIILSENNIDP